MLGRLFRLIEGAKLTLAGSIGNPRPVSIRHLYAHGSVDAVDCTVHPSILVSIILGIHARSASLER